MELSKKKEKKSVCGQATDAEQFFLFLFVAARKVDL